ncbi:DUF4350 domain-containing protein [Halopelagius longus]|uniref:DUF4350 domain-containing protein n=1 Tax=Halopelagius longus TaxID=1236180 RepID=A0A1H1GKF0_9EURY|nr:DUF4350 domain-containing protein [Halopelagius longus]RDI69688.1 DUF4350 domain-containing protein [Halopelagius longus]SDR13641.1 protein of unknown function [Halopelagius longus]
MRRPDVDTPRALLVALVAVCAVSLLFAGTMSSAAFGAFNAGWDGSSTVRDTAKEAGATPTVALETTAYAEADPSETVAFVVAPDDEYTDAEAERLRTFVEEGGTLVVAEDYGTVGNDLLADIGAETRFDGRTVRDLRHHGPTTAMPEATNVSDAETTDGVESIMLNYGTVLTGANGTVLVRTSSYAYLDTDDDGEADEGEPFRSYPVVAAEEVGSGRVVAVSDPSLFINTMQKRADNPRLVSGLVGDRETVLLDYSHSESQPPIRVALIHLRDSSAAQVGLGLFGLLVVGLRQSGRLHLPTLSSGRGEPASPGDGGGDGEAESIAEPNTHRREGGNHE